MVRLGNFQVRSGVAKALALAWLSIACGASVVWLIWYGLTVFDGTPLYDDWAFLDRVRAFNLKEIGWEHLFERHNGHLSVPSRVAYLLVYKFYDLDIEPLRWAAAFANAAAVVLAGALLWRGASGAGEPGEARSPLLHPAVLIGLPLAAGLMLSLGQWETYSVAMCVTNAVSTAFAIAAFLTFDIWLQTRRSLALAASILLGLGATFGMMQGMLVWLIAALMCVAHPDRRRLWPVAVASVLLFVMLALWNALSLPPQDETKNLVRFLTAPFLLLGLPMFGYIRNDSVVTMDVIAGVLLVGASCYAFCRLVGMDERRLRRALPFLALLAYGGGTAILIAWGRQAVLLESIASPRYAGLIAPALIGLVGLLSIAAEQGRAGGYVLGGVAGLCFLGIPLTNQQEATIAPFRAAAMSGISSQLRDPTVIKTEELLNAQIVRHEQFTKDAMRTIPFLERHRLAYWAHLDDEPDR